MEQVLSPYFSTVNLNIIIPSTPSLQNLKSYKAFDQNCPCGMIPYFFNAYYMSGPFHPSWRNYPNKIRKQLQAMNFIKLW